jgi:hypothetical protein
VPQRSCIDKPTDRLVCSAQTKRAGEGLGRFDRRGRSLYVPAMAAANASARGQRAAILASPLHELTGFYLTADCLTSGCNGARTFAIAELASFYGRDATVGAVLAPHALLQGLWRACRGCLTGDRPAGRAFPAPPGVAAW